MDIKFRKLSPLTHIPTRATEQSCGYDLYLPQETRIYPSIAASYANRTKNTYEDTKIHIINFYIALEIPTGYYCELRLRSSITKQMLIFAGSGIIDSDYRGSILAPVINLNTFSLLFHSNDRVAQLILHNYCEINFIESEFLSESTRIGGFGSTGK